MTFNELLEVTKDFDLGQEAGILGNSIAEMKAF